MTTQDKQSGLLGGNNRLEMICRSEQARTNKNSFYTAEGELLFLNETLGMGIAFGSQHRIFLKSS